MRRRALLAGLGVVSLVTVVRRAESADQRRVVAIMSGFAEPEMRVPLQAFRAKLRELGWTEGHNMTFHSRFAGGDYRLLEGQLHELLAAKPDVMVAMGTPALSTIKKAGCNVSVVFTLVSDPVEQGLVESFASPGGCATGFTNFDFAIIGKWVEILKEISPQAQQIVVISAEGNAANRRFSDFIQIKGRELGLDIKTAVVPHLSAILAAMDGSADHMRKALVVLPSSVAVVYARQIIDRAARLGMPAMYPFRSFVTDGGLMYYGLDVTDSYRRAAEYVHLVLRGSKPGDLPVQAPTKLEFVINLKTAKALNLTIPPTLLARADEVIE